MPGYAIANYTVRDPELFEKYPPAVRPTVQQYGGKFLIVDLDAQAKGSPHQVVIVIEFASLETAQQWFVSPEYMAIKHYREDSTDGWVAIFPAFEMPPTG